MFVPSGSMSNQLGVRVHCKAGDEFICEAECHIYNYEQGAFAQLSQVCSRTVQGDYGALRLEQVQGLIRPENEHLVRTKLVCLENTHNRGGGRVLPYDDVVEICAWARAHRLATHMDGARLFNAVVASGIDAATWCQHFDTVSVCFSKGLGAPVGSALAGPRDMIAEARRHRKLFGGGMRQAGIIAAGALYALEHHVERLADDHANAQLLADAIRQIEGLELRPAEVETNLVIFQVDPAICSAPELSSRLKQHGVLVNSFSSTLLRAVTHLDVDRTDVARAAAALKECVRAGVKASAAVASAPY
jgi:threonine aldolase